MRSFLAFLTAVPAIVGLAGCAETRTPTDEVRQPVGSKGEYELTEKVECLVPGEGRMTLIYSSCLTHGGLVAAEAGAADTADSESPSDTAEKAGIKFHVPGLSSRRTTTRDTKSTRYEFVTLKGKPGSYPRAQIFHAKLFPGYVYPRKRYLETSVRMWRFLKDKDLRFSEEKQHIGRLGRVVYRRFSTEDASCFAFQSYFGLESGGENNWGVPSESLAGYYCDRGTIDDTLIDAALKTLDVG